MINKELKEYIEKNIFPKYEKYYSHGMIHMNNVINNVLMLADYYNFVTFFSKCPLLHFRLQNKMSYYKN